MLLGLWHRFEELAMLLTPDSRNPGVKIDPIGSAVEISPDPLVNVIRQTILPVAFRVFPCAVILMIKIGVQSVLSGNDNNPGYKPGLPDRIKILYKFPVLHQELTTIGIIFSPQYCPKNLFSFCAETYFQSLAFLADFG